MGDYDFSGAFIAMAVVGAIVGAIAVGILWFLINHLSITIRWV